MKVYLAGKIGWHAIGEWRDTIVNGLFDGNRKYPTTFTDDVYGIAHWPVMKNSLPGNHDYVGPYYVRDNHWMIIGDHGLITDNKADIFIECQNAISKADIVFAWIPGISEEEIGWGEVIGEEIDTESYAKNHIPTCYGTIAELGMAYAMGKKIMIAGYYEQKELWFVYQMANETLFADNLTAKSAFSVMIPLDYHAYIRSQEWKTKADAAKERAGYRCQICNQPASKITLDAHHRTYERLGQELPEDITVLCRDCHSLYELKKKRRKTNG